MEVFGFNLRFNGKRDSDAGPPCGEDIFIGFAIAARLC
jgi:hypothetical protein